MTRRLLLVIAVLLMGWSTTARAEDPIDTQWGLAPDELARLRALAVALDQPEGWAGGAVTLPGSTPGAGAVDSAAKTGIPVIDIAHTAVSNLQLIEDFLATIQRYLSLYNEAVSLYNQGLMLLDIDNLWDFMRQELKTAEAVYGVYVRLGEVLDWEPYPALVPSIDRFAHQWEDLFRGQRGLPLDYPAQLEIGSRTYTIEDPLAYRGYAMERALATARVNARGVEDSVNENVRLLLDLRQMKRESSDRDQGEVEAIQLGNAATTMAVEQLALMRNELNHHLAAIEVLGSVEMNDQLMRLETTRQVHAASLAELEAAYGAVLFEAGEGSETILPRWLQ